jgi:hypothetical protein
MAACLDQCFKENSVHIFSFIRLQRLQERRDKKRRRQLQGRKDKKRRRQLPGRGSKRWDSR